MLTKQEVYYFCSCYQVLNVIKSLCSMNACRHELEQITGSSFQSYRPLRGHATSFQTSYGPPMKMLRGSDAYRGPLISNGSNFAGSRGGGYNRGGYNNRGYGMGSSYGRGGNWSGGGFRGRY